MNFSGYERDRFFLNDRPGAPFIEVGYGAGLDDDRDGRATVPVDYDGDGDLDLVVLSMQALRLLENRSAGGESQRFLRLSLTAERGPVQAIGAIVKVRTADGAAQLRHVRRTTGFAASVPLSLHFGMGEHKAATVEVTWPSGHIQTFESLSTNQRWRLFEGEKAARALPLVRWSQRVEDVQPQQRFSMPAQVRTLQGEALDPKTLLKNRPAVVNFWASWCEGCKKELPVLAKLSKRKGVAVIGVNLDQKPESAHAMIEAFGLLYPQIQLDEALAKRFFADDRIALPATFVLDAKGQLKRAFYRALNARDLEEALRTTQTVGLQKGDAELLARRGLYKMELGDAKAALGPLSQAVHLKPDYPPALINLAAAHAQLGNLPQAERALLRVVKLRPSHGLALANLGMIQEAQGRTDVAITQYRRALKAQPELQPAHQRLVGALLQKKDRAGALAAAKAWLAVAPQNPRIKGLIDQLRSELSQP